MKIKKLKSSDRRHVALCPTVLITDIDAFAQLMAVVDEYAEKNPDASVLISLDDLGQAHYTSQHAMSSNELDEVEGYDLSSVDAAAFENGEHLGYPSTPSEFFILEANFRKKCAAADFAQACAKGLTLDDDELSTLERINADPAQCLDDEVLLHTVPVREPSMMLSAFPNGYFDSDLDPFENYAVAEHLRQQYGYRLFGIGASCIGFRRAAPLDAGLAQALARDLTRLYNCANDPDKAARFAAIAGNHAHLMLKYVDYIDMD